MVDLIITDSNHVDARSAVDFTLDCAWGKEENDFELVVSGASTIDAGAYIYIEAVSAVAWWMRWRTSLLPVSAP